MEFEAAQGGDAPPHMDYCNDVLYLDTLREAKRLGIIVNAIQCGDLPQTAGVWQSIAQIGGGRFFQVEQAGGAVAMATPYDVNESLDHKLFDTVREQAAKIGLDYRDQTAY